MANYMKRERQVQIVQMAVEGCSIRSIERMAGCHRDTVMRHLIRVGNHCQIIMDEQMQSVRCQYLQLDEIWCYIGKKQKRVQPGDLGEFGDAYTFVALDQDTKLVPAFLVGKRDKGHTYEFVGDLASRIDGHVQISSDGWGSYPGAIQHHFNGRSAYGQIIKAFGASGDQSHRYSPAGLAGVRRIGLWGFPRARYISTSHIERQNLTMRMQMRRFTRLTNAFSKKLESLRAAVALHFAWYNFCRRHSAHDLTPAVAGAIASERWPITRLLPDWGSN